MFITLRGFSKLQQLVKTHEEAARRSKEDYRREVATAAPERKESLQHTIVQDNIRLFVLKQVLEALELPIDISRTGL